MIIDLRKMARSGKESEDFFFLYEPENDLSSIPDVKVVMPVKIEGTVTLTGEHSCLAEGEILFTLKGECTRCLTDSERSYVAEFSEEFSDSDGAYPVVNDKIDLRKIADDAIVTNFPINFLCKEDCKGLCFKCGKNLNEGDCEHVTK